MKDPEEQTEPECLEESFSTHDQSPRARDTNHKIVSRQSTTSVLDNIVHRLARAFNGLHWIIGITTLPEHATRREERSFVLMWVGIIVFMIVFSIVMVYMLTG